MSARSGTRVNADGTTRPMTNTELRASDRRLGITPAGMWVGPKGHWYGECANCGRLIKTTGISRGLHLCAGVAS